jgi:hypothetical protein
MILFLPTNFLTFLKEKLGKFWIFFVFLVHVLTNFSFLKKNHQYHKIGNKKKWKKTLVKLGQTQPRKDPSIAAPGKNGD